MKPTPRVAVVGCGYWGRNVVRNFQSLGALAAVVDPTESGRETARQLAPAADMERLFEHLQEVLDEIDFRDRTASGRNLMDRIRRFLNRAELDQNEANIMRGILTAVQRRRRVAGSAPPP